MPGWVARLSEGREQAADLADGQADQVVGVDGSVLIMPLRCPGKLSTAAGAPFERQ